MQALRIAKADLLREKQRSRELAQEVIQARARNRSMHAVHGLRAPWRRQEREAQCKGAEPLRPQTQPGESRTRALISPRQPHIQFNAHSAAQQRQTSPRRKAGHSDAWPAASFAACNCQLHSLHHLHHLSQPLAVTLASSEAPRLNTPGGGRGGGAGREGGARGAGGRGVPVSAWSATEGLDQTPFPDTLSASTNTCEAPKLLELIYPSLSRLYPSLCLDSVSSPPLSSSSFSSPAKHEGSSLGLTA